MLGNEKVWAVMPAAGAGRRMLASRSKQYLPLAGKAMIEHSLECLLSEPTIEKIFVAVSEEDDHFALMEVAYNPRVEQVIGGAERMDSVLNALQAMDGIAQPADWVLVHDAARPCLPQVDLKKLLEKGRQHKVGAILASPVVDTLKRCAPETDEIAETVDRSGLWRALTPQMFRYGLLRVALEQCQMRHLPVTDEASAMEHLGRRPLLVSGNPCNIKVTYPDDLALADFYLRERASR